MKKAIIISILLVVLVKACSSSPAIADRVFSSSFFPTLLFLIASVGIVAMILYLASSNETQTRTKPRAAGMALVLCPDCNQQVSSKAKQCPHCGNPDIPKPPPTKRRTRSDDANVRPAYLWVGAIALGALILQDILTDDPPPPAPTYQPVDYDLKKRSAAAQAAVIVLKHRMRDPDSFRVHSVVTDERGNTVCVAYQARNGFGGMTQEDYILVGDTPRQGWSDWCTGPGMHNMTDSVR